MVFNAGRYAAYASWYGGADVGPRVATATGIGHLGSDLVVHCLTAEEPGLPVENPRQVPAYRYSRRRGPMPPLFARATMIGSGSGRMLLVGGTSSVCGESSVHLGDVQEQTLETFHNLGCLAAGEAGDDPGRARPSDVELRRQLAAYRTLRVYCVHASDLQRVQEMVKAYLPGLESLELCRADVCRRTLLVEIEGTASGVPAGGES
jgi:chorismate lyase/3-hydroxybenzoate synthase